MTFFTAFADELTKIAEKGSEKKKETAIELTQRQINSLISQAQEKAREKLREAGTVEGRKKMMMRRMMWGG